MVENSELYYQSSADQFEVEEIVPEEAPPPPKVSFLERFFLRSNDVLVGLTAGIRIDNSAPGNHWNLR